MKFVLLSDEKVIYDGEATKVCCCSQSGPFIIMDGHVPYIAKIQGELSYEVSGKSSSPVKIREGFIYTNGNTCFAVVDSE